MTNKRVAMLGGARALRDLIMYEFRGFKWVKDWINGQQCDQTTTFLVK